jgi:hypothetical protein
MVGIPLFERGFSTEGAAKHEAIQTFLLPPVVPEVASEAAPPACFRRRQV